MTSSPEPSVDPSHLLRALRVFVAEAAEPAEDDGSKPASDTSQHDGEELSWEEAGCLLWDVAAVPDDAAFLLNHGLPAMLPPLLTAAAARERWRALEIALGTAANLACHDDARRQLVELEGFPALLLDRLLWVDDVGSLTEVCRCASALLAAGFGGEAAEAWWMLLLREETLGRVVWMVENTLSCTLLERALNLLTCLVAAACAAKASGDGSKVRLVPQLACALGLLPLLASVLHGWVVRLQAERRHFGGADSAGGSPAAQLERAKAHAPSLQQEEGQQQQQQQGHGQTGADEPASNDASGAALKAVDAAAATELEQDAEAGGAVAAEISEPAAVETLALLEAIAADVAGEAALNESVLVKDALLRLVAEAELHSMRALAISLLAGLEGVGPLLLAQPPALAAVLASLQAAAQAHPGKRQRTEASGQAGAAASVGGDEARAEEVEAAWALCSAAAKAADSEGGQQDGREALAVLVAHAGVLCHDWSAIPRALAIQMHQGYVLRHLMPLFGEQTGEPRAALARCQAGIAQVE